VQGHRSNVSIRWRLLIAHAMRRAFSQSQQEIHRPVDDRVRPKRPTRAGGASPSKGRRLKASGRGVAGGTQMLPTWREVRPRRGRGRRSSKNLQRSAGVRVFANVDRSELGSVGGESEKIIHQDVGEKTPRGPTHRTLEVNTPPCRIRFYRLGMADFSGGLVYLLTAVNLQSWWNRHILMLSRRAWRYRLDDLHYPDHSAAVADGIHHCASVHVATANSILLWCSQRSEGWRSGTTRFGGIGRRGHTRIRQCS